MQRLLEELYAVETELHVEDFVLAPERLESTVGKEQAAQARAARETLFVTEDQGALDLALYVDPADVEALAGAANGGATLLLRPLLRLIEGVSHFVYLAWRARDGQRVSSLELELQGEVDKFAALAIGARDSGPLRRTLYALDDVRMDLSPDLRDRYRAAVGMASLFARHLEDRFVRTGRRSEMVRALRRFYRLPREQKIAYCLAA